MKMASGIVNIGLPRDKIGWGILNFGGSISFGVKSMGEELQYFKMFSTIKQCFCFP